MLSINVRVIIAFSLLLLNIIRADSVCTNSDLIIQLIQDLKDNGKLDCKRVPLPPPIDRKEIEEERIYRLEAAWDTDCAFEASYDWLKILKENYGLKNGLVDRDGNPVDYNLEDEADMCEIVRAMVAGGLIDGLKLDQLSEDSFKDLDCPGQGEQSRICAVSGGSAAQQYSWYILLEAKSIETSMKPRWKMDSKSKELLKVPQ